MEGVLLGIALGVILGRSEGEELGLALGLEEDGSLAGPKESPLHAVMEYFSQHFETNWGSGNFKQGGS